MTFELVDPCLTTVIDAFPTLQFTYIEAYLGIESGVALPKVSDSTTAWVQSLHGSTYGSDICGPFTYTVIDQNTMATLEFLTLVDDPINTGMLRLGVSTLDSEKVGFYNLELSAFLTDYPLISPVTTSFDAYLMELQEPV